MKKPLILLLAFIVIYLCSCGAPTQEQQKADKSATIIVNKIDQEIVLDMIERQRVYDLLKVELESIYRTDCR